MLYMKVSDEAPVAVRLPSKDVRNRLVAFARFQGKSLNQLMLETLQPLINESNKLVYFVKFEPVTDWEVSDSDQNSLSEDGVTAHAEV